MIFSSKKSAFCFELRTFYPVQIVIARMVTGFKIAKQGGGNAKPSFAMKSAGGNCSTEVRHCLPAVLLNRRQLIYGRKESMNALEFLKEDHQIKSACLK